MQIIDISGYSPDRGAAYMTYTATRKKGTFTVAWDDTCIALTGQHAAVMGNPDVLQALFGNFFSDWVASLEHTLKTGAICILEHTLHVPGAPLTVRHTITPKTKNIVAGDIRCALPPPILQKDIDFTNLFSDMPIPAFYINEDLRVQWANKAGAHEIQKTNTEGTPWQGEHCYTLLFGKGRPCTGCLVRHQGVEGASIRHNLSRPDGSVCTKTLTKRYDQEGAHIGTLVTWSQIPGTDNHPPRMCHAVSDSWDSLVDCDKTLHTLHDMLVQEQGDPCHLSRSVLKLTTEAFQATRVTAYVLAAENPVLFGEYCSLEHHHKTRPLPIAFLKYLARCPHPPQRAAGIADTQALHLPVYVAREFLRRRSLAALYCPVPTDGGICILLVEQTTPRAWTTEEQRLAETVALHVSLLAGMDRHRKTDYSLTNLINSLPGMFFRRQSFSDDGPLAYAGGACRELTGYDAASLTTDKDCDLARLVHPEDREMFTAASDPTRGPAEGRELAFRLNDKNGHLHWVRQRAWVAANNDTAAPPTLEGVFLDVSEHHLLQQAQQANENKRAFLATMSHEIRTPMNIIIGMARQALKSGLSEEQRRYISNIHSAAASLLTIVDDILDYSKVEAGKLSLECAPFHLEELVRQLKALFNPLAVEKNLKFTVTTEENLPKIVTGDPARISQVLINLVNNALKFTEEGSVYVTFAAVEQQEDSILLRFTVQDTGIGIAPERHQSIFKAFQPPSRTEGQRFSGAGLGLAISKMLATFMDGDITVDSTPGVGTTMTFTCRVTLTIPVTAAMPQENQAMPQFHGGTILLVEDNRINQEIALALLKEAGFTTTVAQNGREALEILHNYNDDCPFSLILMDLQMPELDGYQTTTFIRGNKKWDHTPIIAMTAHAMGEERERCMEIGMQGYIMKPIDSKTFYQTLSTFLLAT